MLSSTLLRCEEPEPEAVRLFKGVLFALQHDKVRRRKAARDEHAASVSAAAGGDGSGSCSGHRDGSGGDGGGA